MSERKVKEGRVSRLGVGGDSEPTSQTAKTMSKTRSGRGGRGGGVRDGKDDKQPKIDDKYRRGSFMDEKEIQELKGNVMEELKKIRKEKIELGKFKTELENKMEELSEKVNRLPKRLEDYENREKVRDSVQQAFLSARTEEEDSEAGTREGATASCWSLVSSRSGQSGISARSAASRYSLSERDVRLMKKFVVERDRRERENNIVIRGMTFYQENVKERIVGFLKEKLDIKGDIETAWISGKVKVARVNRELKTEIMRKKNRLAGSRIFIENDFNFEDRKRQEELYAWVKEKRELGLKMRAGQGKILFRGKWFRWDEKEKIEREI